MMDIDSVKTVFFHFLEWKWKSFLPGICDIECRWFEQLAYFLHSIWSSAYFESVAMRWPAQFYGRKRFSLRLCSQNSNERNAFLFFFWNLSQDIWNYLNMTSLNSGLFTNFGSIREPFAGCSTSSLIGLIGSQPKHVANISANNSVVPSFCKLWGFFFAMKCTNIESN